MAASICHSKPQGMHSPGHLHSPVVQPHGSTLSSPFVFMSPELQSSPRRSQKLVLDFPLLSPQKIGSFEPATEAFCTTITVSDIAMEPAASQRPAGPLSSPTSSVTATPTTAEKDAKTPTRRSLESSKEHQSTKTGSSSARRRRSGSQTPGSRSPSRHKAVGPTRSKPLAYSQTQGERDLVALHRESCRLFESFGAAGNTASGQSSPNSLQTPANLRICHSFTEPLHNSPSLKAHSASPPEANGPSNETEAPQLTPLRDDADQAQEDQLPEQKPIPATVMDWTLPSTRKREYEKIDRSNRGIRGLWRKLAPRCLHGRGKRTPFFDETKRGKDYEGSVRRFRIDVPDDADGDGTESPTVVPIMMEAKATEPSVERSPEKPKRGLFALSRRHTKA